MIVEYLLQQHLEECLAILNHPDELSFHSVLIDFLKLFEFDPDVGDRFLCSPISQLPICDHDIVKTQEQILADNKTKHASYAKVKQNVRARFNSLPVCPELHRVLFPTNVDLGSFLKVTGTVTRMTQSKMLEFKRKYVCLKCKQENIIEGDYEQRYILRQPTKCSNTIEKCRSTHFSQVAMVSREHCKDYQEIRIQEHAKNLSVGGIPGSMWITLEEDLVDKCKPGDDVIVCGVVRRRWRPTVANKRCDVELVFQANYLEVSNLEKSKTLAVAPDVRHCFDEFWNKYKACPMRGRDVVLGSVCPQVFGLHLVKLALLLTVVSGSSLLESDMNNSDNEQTLETRGQCHLLLVGDPGTGKSQLLQAGAELTPRSVLTCGTSSTKAGLTCAAIREDGEWQLEAGALVLSDGGACCVDEIGHLPVHDRAAIHEAMEQQTISVAKAGIVCKLNTRCAVIAACNPKGKYDVEQPLSVNVSLGTPLLSRFDLIFILLDNKNEEWDKLISSYILFGESSVIENQPKWNIEKLQMYIVLVGPQKTIVSEDANLIMRSYYMHQRQSNQRDPSRTTVRMLDSLVRLSQAHCKIMYRTQVIPMDAIVAISLIDLSMQDCAMRDSNKALRSTRSKYPDLEYLIYAKEILHRLSLPDMWKKELLFYGNIMNVDTTTLDEHVTKGNTRLFHFGNDEGDSDIPLSATLVTSSYFDVKKAFDTVKTKESDIDSKLANTLKKIANNEHDFAIPAPKKPKKGRKALKKDEKVTLNDVKSKSKKNKKHSDEKYSDDELFYDSSLLDNVASVNDVLRDIFADLGHNDETVQNEDLFKLCTPESKIEEHNNFANESFDNIIDENKFEDNRKLVHSPHYNDGFDKKHSNTLKENNFQTTKKTSKLDHFKCTSTKDVSYLGPFTVKNEPKSQNSSSQKTRELSPVAGPSEGKKTASMSQISIFDEDDDDFDI